MRSSKRSRLGIALTLAAALVPGSAVAQEGGEEGPTVESYRLAFGLTGAPGNRNDEARTQVEPLLQELRDLRSQFLTNDRILGANVLELLAERAHEVLSYLPPAPGDDRLLLRALAECGAAVTLLDTFREYELSRNLAQSLGSVYAELEASHPWNPVLRAYNDGAMLKRAYLGGPQ